MVRKKILLFTGHQLSVFCYSIPNRLKHSLKVYEKEGNRLMCVFRSLVLKSHFSEQTHAVTARADLGAHRWGRGGRPVVPICLQLSSSASVLSMDGQGRFRDLLEL